MKKHVKSFAASLISLLLIFTLAPTSQGYTPPYDNVKVGLYFGANALPSANLANVSGLASGFDFGFFDASRQFVPLAYTNLTAISMMKDRNMFFGEREYAEGTDGTVIVGCYHIILTQSYSSFEDAANTAANYPDSFVKYENGNFFVCIGNYTSNAGALNAIAQMELPACSVTAGTAQTLTVVETGTSNIIFEYDCGTSSYLAVKPRQSGEASAQTWFRNNKYYGAFEYIRLTGDNLTVVNTLNIEDYTKCVVPRESPSTWPLEALKVQALCSRTYAMSNLNKHKSLGFDMCNDEDCQVYGGINATTSMTDRAVDETVGLYITYNGKLCQTYFSSSNGGASESSENVWYDAIPYLRGVVDPYEADIAGTVSNYSWKVTYTPEKLTERMKSKGYNCATIVSLQVTEYTPTGNVYTITLKDANGSTYNITKGEKVRSVLGVNSIRFTVGGAVRPGQTGQIAVNNGGVLAGTIGSAFAIGGDGSVAALPASGVTAITGSGEIEAVTGGASQGVPGSPDGKINGLFTIEGTGRGHNVGVSQWGTYSMAKFHNKSFSDIINFYYTGVEIG